MVAAADPTAAVGVVFMEAVAAAFTEVVEARSTVEAEAARIVVVDRIGEAVALRTGAGMAVAAELTAEAWAAAAGARVLHSAGADLVADRARADSVTAVVRRDHAARLTVSGIRSAERAEAHRPARRPEQHEIPADHLAAREALLAQQAVPSAAREIPLEREIRRTRMERGIRLVGLAAEAQRAAALTLSADLTRRRTRTRSVQEQDRIEAFRIPQVHDSIAPRPLLPLLLLDTRHFPVRGPAPAAHSEALVQEIRV